MNPDNYKGKYRIPTNRLQGFDYGNNAAYFVTICTHDKFNYLGEISPFTETQGIASQINETKNQFGPQSQNLASVIRGYKSGVKIYAAQHDLDFHWQSRYHDRVIRSDKELQNIRNYIFNNPVNWQMDDENPSN